MVLTISNTWLCRDDYLVEVEEIEAVFEEWLNKKHWTANEAIYLLNGMNPEVCFIDGELESVEFLPREPCPERKRLYRSNLHRSNRDPIAMVAEADLKRTRRFIALEGEPWVRLPREWLKLAAENRHRVPWLEFALSRPALKKYLPEGEEDRERRIKELEEENRDLRTQLERKLNLEGKERTSALKIIAGMVKAFYGWDLRTWDPETYKQIYEDLQRKGIKLADNTLRKWFKEAAVEVDNA